MYRVGAIVIILSLNTGIMSSTTFEMISVGGSNSTVAFLNWLIPVIYAGGAIDVFLMMLDTILFVVLISKCRKRRKQKMEARKKALIELPKEYMLLETMGEAERIDYPTLSHTESENFLSINNPSYIKQTNIDEPQQKVSSTPSKQINAPAKNECDVTNDEYEIIDSPTHVHVTIEEGNLFSLELEGDAVYENPDLMCVQQQSVVQLTAKTVDEYVPMKSSPHIPVDDDEYVAMDDSSWNNADEYVPMKEAEPASAKLDEDSEYKNATELLHSAQQGNMQHSTAEDEVIDDEYSVPMIPSHILVSEGDSRSKESDGEAKNEKVAMKDDSVLPHDNSTQPQTAEYSVTPCPAYRLLDYKDQ